MSSGVASSCSASSWIVGERPSSCDSLGHDPVHPQTQLLERTRHPDRPGLVPEVALQLAQDRRRGVRGEADLAGRIEPIDRAQQADVGDLVQVLDGLAPPGEASREVLRERLEPGDEVVLRRGVFRDALEQPKHL